MPIPEAKSSGDGENSWGKWSVFVLKELERHDRNNEEMENKMDTLRDVFLERLESTKSLLSDREETNFQKLTASLNKMKEDVLKEVGSVKDGFTAEINKFKIDYTEFKIGISKEVKLKSGVWGALAALIPLAIAIGIAIATGLIKFNTGG